MEKFKNQESNIIEFANNIKTNKNPFSILFSLAELKEIFISIGETLLNSIELNYSKKAREEYLDIFSAYKKEGIFEVTYDYYLNSKNFYNFKKQLFSYFETSFFYDISFFYFTLSQDPKYKTIFSALELFYSNPILRKKYFSFDNYIAKNEFLREKIPIYNKIFYEKDSYFVVKFLDNFSTFNFELLVPIYNNGISLDIKIIKNITIFSIRNRHRYRKLYNLILETFALNTRIYNETIEYYDENKLFEIISFLRKELISGINIDTMLNYNTKVKFDKFIQYASSKYQNDLDENLFFLVDKEMSILKLGNKKGELARIYFKRRLLEKKYPGIIDLTLSIISLPQEVFYLFKEKTKLLNLVNLHLYTEIKDLILYIDRSFYLNLIRPFLLKHISHYFNNSDNKYYIIKFILCIILPSSYSEYRRISKFFYNLECFSRDTNEAAIGRISQFGWIYIIVIGLLFFAPFGVFLAIVFYLLKNVFVLFIGKVNPRLKMSLNFQFSSFAVFFGICTLLLSLTVGIKDNSYLFYESFKPFINASVLPTKEVINIIGDSFIKADINNYYTGPSLITFSDIDYIKGPTFQELKDKKEEEKKEKLSPVPLIEEVVINQSETIKPPLTDIEIPKPKKDYSKSMVNKENTLWEYASKMGKDCLLIENKKDFDKKISDSLETFLKENKKEFLKKLPHSYSNISIWEIPKFLPQLEYDLNRLNEIVCLKK